ncbi:M24 family metallopeptidase [Desulfosporosinus lacus]|uniref:Xaa-Pro aminopeptidase n=1 Tax=Desulfosporosinus lacus DSM 15449 TaxID=1121420 RepID=A0A1M6H1H5_9FIRM|nr:Xaa-Pro peptidase family protein [Desulfosporosinus lacus]SHJ16039.1 Xaa-Pro aminopeptidase [Desulfosporosinus lacus DSM 15449]
MRLTPAGELTRRITALQKLLQQKGVDGALIVDSVDMFYFAGIAHRAYLFIPAEGKPLLMVKRSFTRAQGESALADIIPLANVKDLTKMLNEYGYNNITTLGLELDVLPAALYLLIQKLFEGAQIVDVSGLIRSVRMVKSSFELEVLRDAAQLNYTLFSRVKDYLKEGITELELAGQLEMVYRLAGHSGRVKMRGFDQEVYYGHVLSGINGAIPSCMESPTGGLGVSISFPQGAGYKKIARNEPVMIDFVGVKDGYLADQTRIYCIGQLPDKLVHAHETALLIQEAVKQMAVPGALCEDIYWHAMNMAAESGYGEHFMGYSEPVAFIGHGIGIELNEWPVLAPGFKTPLEKNMVIAIEPKFIFPEGAVGIENTFLVGEKGLETLTLFNETIIYIK